MIRIILHPKVDHYGIVAIITAQLHSPKLELRFYACSNPVRDMPICDGVNLWWWSQLEIQLGTFYSVNHTTKTIHHHDCHHQELLTQPRSPDFKNYIRSMYIFNPVYQTQSVSKVMSSDADYFRFWELLMF